MLKTSRFMDELYCPTHDTLTPIRDYDNDYFHCNDDKLPQFKRLESVRKSPRISNSYRNSSNFKRPASLDLSEIGEQLTKRVTPSPLNTELFDKIISLKSATSIKSGDIGTLKLMDEHTRNSYKFYECVKNLYESEIKYIEMMEVANKVYRKSLHDNIHFKNKIIKRDSNDEILLFGNIDTITSISKIFIMSLKGSIIERCDYQINEINDYFWNKILFDQVLHGKNYSKFHIGEIFEQHLYRIKSTYLNYFVTQTKQLEFYDHLKSNADHHFQKWSEYCLKRGHLYNLETILKRPMERLGEWIQTLSLLYEEGDNVVSGNIRSKIKQTKERYLEFKSQIEEEIIEYNGLEKYDYTLTPMEIIGSYVMNMEQKEDNTLKVRKSSQLRKSSNISPTSSVYPDDEFKAVSATTMELPDDGISPTQTNLTLPESIAKFKKVFRDVHKLRNMFCKLDLLSLADANIDSVKSWNNIVQCCNETTSDTFIQGKGLAYLPQAMEYLNEMMKIKEKITILKLTDFEVGIMIPINKILKFSYKVRHNLKDLRTLKKDYIIYLKEKKTNVYDVKRDVIGKHYEALQDKLTEELPVFIKLVHAMTKMILINYNKMMLHFFEIIAGGNDKLQQDMASNCREHKDCVDILQQFTQSRENSRRVIKENWSFNYESSTSKAARKLFQ